MSKQTCTHASAEGDLLLQTIRGEAPRRTPSVRTLAAYAQHTDCNLATLGFAAGVDFDRLLKDTPYQAPFGQSPFAFARGLQFEGDVPQVRQAAIRQLGQLGARLAV